MATPLVFDIVARLAKFNDSLDAVKRSASQTAASLESAFAKTRSLIGLIAGAVAVRAAVSSFAELAQAADAIGKRAQAVGLTAEALQTLQFAAGQSGVQAEELDQAMAKLAVGIADFERGTGKAAGALAALGFSAQQLKGLGLEGALLAIADKFQTIQDGAGKAALVAKIFGEDIGRKLVPFLNEGAGGIRKLQDEAKRLGGIFSDDLVIASAKFNDNMEKLGRTMTELKIKAFGPLIKDLADIAALFGSAAGAALNFGEKLKLIFSGNVNLGRYSELVKQEAELRGQLERAQKDFGGEAPELRERVLGGLEGRLDAVQKERAELAKLMQVREAVFAEDKPKPAAKLAPAPGLVDLGAFKGAQKALADLEAARAKALEDGERHLADIRLELLDRFHAKGLIGEEDYWNRRLEIQRAAMEASVKAADQEIAARQAALASAPRGTAEYYQALKSLEEAQRRRNDLERGFAEQTTKNYLDASDAAQAYGDQVARLNAQMLQLQGHTAEAVAITTRLDQQALRRQAQSNRDTATLALLDNLQAASAAQASFNDERQRGEDILRELAILEERIQNSQRVGAIGELEALNQTGAARQEAVRQLTAIRAALDATAQSSGLPELTRQAQDFGAKLDSLAASSHLLAQKFDSITSSAFGDLLYDFTSRTKTAKQAFEDFGKSIVDQVNKIVSQELGTKLARSLFGDQAGAGGGAGGFLANLLSGNFFGGGGGAAAAMPLAGASAYAGFAAPFATGGSFVVGGSGGVDSQLVALRATPGERVSVETPAQQQRPRAAGISITVNVPQGTGRASAGQIAAEVGAAVSRATRRNL